MSSEPTIPTRITPLPPEDGLPPAFLVEASSGRWTKELPKKDGFYWYREDGSNACVVEFDAEGPCVTSCGNDVPLAPYMGPDRQIEGEFWSERLEPPQ